MRRSETEKEIRDLIRAFEDATIRREDWKHAEHLTVGLYLVMNHDLDEAISIMREGLLKLLRAQGVDLTEEMPYHETLTVFWMRTLLGYSLRFPKKNLVEKCKDMLEMFDKEYPLKFYTRELLFSDEARARYIEPDLNTVDL